MPSTLAAIRSLFLNFYSWNFNDQICIVLNSTLFLYASNSILNLYLLLLEIRNVLSQENLARMSPQKQD